MLSGVGCTAEVTALTRKRAAVATTKTALENKLQSNLLKRLEELKTVIESPVADEHSEQLERDSSELKDATARVDELDRQLKQLDTSIEQKEDRLRLVNNKLEDLKVLALSFSLVLKLSILILSPLCVGGRAKGPKSGCH